MKTSILLILASCLSFFAFMEKEDNPFLKEFSVSNGVPPFDQIKVEHYLPAFKEGIKQQQAEIELIVNSSEAPDFENTIAAMESSGALLDRVSSVFYNMMSSNTSEELQKIAKDISPLLSKHNDDILLNEKLFKKVKSIYEQKDKLLLTEEQKMLLEKTYKEFVRGGANLDEQKKNQLREINKELSLLSLQFGENLLKETNAFELVIEKESDLSGLPQTLINSASETAKGRGYKNKWVFTLQNPSIMPFLQYADNRLLREKIFKAYINRGNNNNKNDNKVIITKIASLRVKRANLLGYKTHADFVLDENMAKTSENVYKLLRQLWTPALKVAKKETEELQQMIHKEGNTFKLEAWDWRYYAEKLRKEKYDLDDEQLRPYFKLENVREGAFLVANKLYGVTFSERTDLPKYHNEAKAFEVREADGKFLGILYTDYFPRESKRGGAWCSSFRKQSIKDGKEITPVMVNVCNFSKSTGDKPALLTFEEVTTLFHEFGHALHGLLSHTTYDKLSGSAVPRDFVELPSQIMENWAGEPEVLKTFAKHYKTGETIPQELVDKIKNSEHYGQGFATVEYLAASFLDLDWHTLADTNKVDAEKFETNSLNKIGLMPEIVVRYRSTYFNHIFNGGYSSGYYSYIWAEVLDADAFEAFKETSLFDQKTARSFRDNILSKGGTEEAMTLYKRFRGSDPKIEPLLKRRGLESGI
ncbi:MAG: M3 family metallopeptidase [Bacteroidota bacterium]|nr:M3 family metallopeptidase [Bacteroidota bacterium]